MTLEIVKKSQLLLSVLAVVFSPIMMIAPQQASAHIAPGVVHTNDCVGMPVQAGIGSDGKNYRTFTVGVTYDSTVRGHTLRSGGCTLTRVLGSGMSQLEYYGQFADQIYFGPDIPGVWSATRSGSPCSPIMPTPGPGIVCTDSTAGRWEILQDDASALGFNGNLIHCYGINELCNNGPWGGPNPWDSDPSQGVYADIYARGTEDSPAGNPNAIRGAGAFDISPMNLTGMTTVNPDGTLADIPLSFVVRNTWQGGYGATATFTVRYKSVVADMCPNIAGNQTAVPAGMIVDGSGNCVAPPPANSCPSMPSPAEQSISLPYSGPSGGSVPGSGPYGATYQSYGSDGTYQINSVIDEWGQSGGWRPPGRSGNPFVIEYQNFVADYPYDFHTPGVSYTSYYWRDNYSATGSANWFDPPGVCNRWEGNIFADPPDLRCTDYNDPPPYIVDYNVVYDGRDNDLTAGGYTTAPQMSPCWDRAFRNVTPNTSKPYFDPDNEQPNYAFFGSQTSVEMYLPQRQTNVRESLKVMLDINANYYVRKANGSTIAWPQGGHVGQLSGTNLMFNSGSNGSTGTAINSYTDRWDATIPPLEVGDRACFQITGLQRQGTMRPDGSRTSQSGSAGPTFENCSDPLVNQPYLRVYGNDVMAGGAFTGGVCSDAAGINAFYGRSGGSGSQLGAMAIGAINGFVSAVSRGPANSLTFANTPSLGNFGGGHCLPDYFATRPTPESAVSSPGSISFALMNGAYYVNSNAVISDGDLPNDRHITLYVNGDLTIADNIAFIGSGGWTQESQIPSLFIVARNIYIQRNVTQLDGVYVAQPVNATAPNSPTLSGRIYTCTNGVTPVSVEFMYDQCNSQLTVNGTFIAQKVNFLRGYSSMRNAPSGENAAEVIRFSPEVYLTKPSMRPVLRPTSGKYEFISSLAPVL